MTVPSGSGTAVWLLTRLVRVYQLSLAVVLGGRCRFHPHCSQYAILALHRHGAVKGSLMALWRILRCGPWGGHGFDPVPEVWHEVFRRGKHRRRGDQRCPRNVCQESRSDVESPVIRQPRPARPRQ